MKSFKQTKWRKEDEKSSRLLPSFKNYQHFGKFISSIFSTFQMEWFDTYPKYSFILLVNASRFKTEINFKNKTYMPLSCLTPSQFLKSGPDSDFSDWSKQFCSFFTVGLFKLDFKHIYTLHLVVMLFILYLPPDGLLSLLPSLCFCHQLPGVRVLFNVPCFAIG